MSRLRWPLPVVAILAFGAGCKRAPEPAPEPTPEPPALEITDVNGFFARGTPSFVVGTAGDDGADDRIAAQVALVRGLLLPGAPLVADTAVAGAAASEWPANPILYGGADTNAVVAALADRLPYRVDAHSIEIGGERFDGPGYRLIAATPAGDGHPAFVLYAGTGEDGIAEINAGLPLDAAILVADAFGPLVQGRWRRRGDRVVAELGAPRRRIEYRTRERQLALAGAGSMAVRFHFPAMVAATEADEASIEASLRGLDRAARRLGIESAAPVSIYVYPDRESKRQLTGQAGDGHAVPSSRALHVRVAEAEALESLIAHEAVHVLGYRAWGAPRTPLMGEGIAVWAAGRYGGRDLAAWAGDIEPVPIAELLGPGWLRLAEPRRYPLAGLLVETAVAEVGVAGVRDHLVPATAESWARACAAAGTSAEKLETALAARLRSASAR